MFGFSNSSPLYGNVQDSFHRNKLFLDGADRQQLLEDSRFGRRRLNLWDRRVQIVLALVLYGAVLAIHGCT